MATDATLLALGIDSSSVPPATAALDKLEKQSRTTEAAADRLIESWSRQAATAGKTKSEVMALEAAHLGLSKSQQEAAQRAIDATRAYEQQAAAMERMQTAAKGIAGVIIAAAAAMVVLIKHALDANDRLQEFSDQTGISAAALGGLGFAAEQSGSTLEKLVAGLSRMADKAAEAAGGSEKANAAFAAMGISVTTSSGALKGQDELLAEIATKFAGYADGTAKVALAQDLFGKGARDLIPLLNRGADGIEELKQKYLELGGATDEMSARANAFNDLLAESRARTQALAGQFVDGLIPALTDTINSWKSAGSAASAFHEIGHVLGELLATLSVNAQMAGAAFKALGMLIGAAAAATVQAVQGNFSAAKQIMVDVVAEIDAMGAKIQASYAVAKALRDQVNAGLTGPATFDARDYQALGDKISAPIVDASKKVKAAREQMSAEMKQLIADYAKFSDLLVDVSEHGASYDKVLESLNRLYLEGIITLDQYVDAEDRLFESMSNVHKEAERAAAQVLKAYNDALKQNADALAKSVEEIEKQVAAERARVEQFGLSKTQITELAILEEQRTLAILQSTDADEASIVATKARIAALRDLQAAQAQTQGLEDNKRAAEETERAWQQTIANISQVAGDFLTDFAAHGKSAFKNLWDSFASWALHALAQIAARQVIVSVTGAVGLAGAGGAGASGGAGSVLSGVGSLFGGNSGIGSLIGGASSVGIGSAVTGGITSVFGSGSAVAGIGAELGAGAAAEVGAAAAGAGGLAGIAGTVAAAIPVVGWVIAAAALIYSIVQANKKPSPARGQFDIAAADASIQAFEDSQATLSRFGLIGFADQGTQQFSGEAGQVLNKMVAGALDQFAARMSGEQVDHLSSILQNTVFQAFEGTFTTEDFLGKFGGQILQQVIGAAFNELDPALGKVFEGFHGTAEEVAKFADSLLALHDAEKDFSDTFKANIAGALSDATQATADKVVSFVSIFQLLGDKIDGLGPKMEALDPESILAFVDALGGAQAALQSQAFIAQNFFTSGDRLAEASRQLDDAFAALGVSIPHTHDEFLALLGSFDLTTDAGRRAYAAVSALAQAFIAVHGTADAAAQATQQQAEANRQLVDSARQFFEQNFYSDAERSARAAADATAALDAAQAALGVSIPRSVEGFRALIESIDQTTPAGQALYAALIVLAPAIMAVSANADAAASSISTSVNIIATGLSALDRANEAADGLRTAFDNALKAIDEVVNNSAGDRGDKLGLRVTLLNEQISHYQDLLAQAMQSDPYGPVATALRHFIDQLGGLRVIATQDLARFTVLKAQYGEAIAGQLLDLEHWYITQQQALAGNNEALAALAEIFGKRYQDIIDGTADAVGTTLDKLAELRKGIREWLDGLTIGDLSPLTPAQKLEDARKQFEKTLEAAQKGDPAALADITRAADAYLRLARDAFASSPQYTEIFNFIRDALGRLASPPPGVTTNDLRERGGKDILGPGAILNGDTQIIGGNRSADDLIADALPTAGRKLASSDDVKALGERIARVVMDSITALADANSDDSKDIGGRLQRLEVSFVEAINNGLK